jgi:hypothetical protein
MIEQGMGYSWWTWEDRRIEERLIRGIDVL